MMAEARSEIEKLVEIYEVIHRRLPHLEQKVAMQATIAIYSKLKPIDKLQTRYESNEEAHEELEKLLASSSVSESPETKPHVWKIDFSKPPKRSTDRRFTIDHDFEYEPQECDFCGGENCRDECVNYDIDDACGF